MVYHPILGLRVIKKRREVQSSGFWILGLNPPLSQTSSHTIKREFFIDNPLVRIHHYHLDDFSRPALRHGTSNSIYHVAQYLPSYPKPSTLNQGKLLERAPSMKMPPSPLVTSPSTSSVLGAISPPANAAASPPLLRASSKGMMMAQRTTS